MPVLHSLRATDTGKAITSTEMMTIKASITTGTVTATFVYGMTTTEVIFHLDSPRKTVCLQAWKNSLCGVASFHPGFRSVSNHVLRSSNGSYLLPLPIASMF
jgi:hypothetical protein